MGESTAAAGTIGPAVLCLVFGLAATDARAQEPRPYRFRTETRIVLAPVSVKDAAGRPVTGLPASAFMVLDEGEPRPLVFFDEGDEPLSTVLVLDVSSSMRGERLAEAKRAATTFVEQIASPAGTGTGEMALIAFDDRVRVAVPWCSEQGRILAVMESLEASGGTALYDAIEAALDLAAGARNRRRAIVVLSDGMDQDSRGSFALVRARAEGTEASVFSVGFYTPEERQLFTPENTYFKEPPFEVNRNPAWVLAELARSTGGLALFPSKGDELRPVFESIAAELHHQYLLGFEPAAEAGGEPQLRRIEIRISSPEHRGPFSVRGRPGYASRGGATSQQGDGSVADAELEIVPR
jgi:VWFA-related protein